MSEKIMKKSRTLIAALLGTVMIAALTIWGCGTSSYDNPQDAAVTTKTATALIDAATLKQWVDAGLVNKAGGYDRVVILDVTANAADGTNKYNSVGHIPGAYLVPEGNAYFQAVRAEGPLSTTGALVCTGATMDTLIQNAGIDKNTTIVVTSSGSFVDLTRTYATFRYWGFPKNRIKVLNGGNAAWPAADLTSKASTVVKSTYGVSQNQSNVNTDMRTSLVEMIAYVKGIVAGNANKVTLIDTVRGVGSPPAVNSTISGPTGDLITSGVYTPFDGAIKGSYSYHATRMVTGGLYFKDAAAIKDDLRDAFGTDGVTPLGEDNRDTTKTFVSFCRAGNYASVGYFALDGIAYYGATNVDVKWYDGSLGQFNLMASSDHTAVDTTGATVNAGGKLKVGSIWDTTSLMDNLTWNVNRTVNVPVVPATVPPTTMAIQTPIVNYATRVYGVEPSFAEGNQLEDADKAYRSVVTTTTGGAASTGGGGC
ncbi:MAG: selenite/tellurite reduction operon rhodanese-like protein ExtH [Desulfuromonadaceae bacterium]